MEQSLINSWLLDCLNLEPTAQKVERLHSLSNETWNAVVYEAERHGVTPLLYRRLQPLLHILPNAMSQQLRKVYLANAYTNTRRYHELQQVLLAFQQAQIPVIVLKGAYLAEAIYKNIAVRMMGDVDLLVQENNLADAQAVLLAQGYQFRQQVTAMDNHLRPLYKPDGHLIELHWTIMGAHNQFAVDLNGLWERSLPVKIAGIDVRAFSAVDLILHLALHAAYQHQYVMGIGPLCDLLEVLSQAQADFPWSELIARAKLWRMGNLVYLTLLLCQELLNAAFPDTALKELRPADFNPSLLDQAKAQIFAPTDAKLSPSRNLTNFWGSQGIYKKAQVLFDNIFLAPSTMARMYPVDTNSPRLYFYYAVRMSYLIRQHTPIIWQRWRKRSTQDEFYQQEKLLFDWLGAA